MSNIAFIGLGVMGDPMAGHLVRAGHDVTVYNRTNERAVSWQNKHHGNIAKSPRDAATNAEFVFTCVGNDDDLRAVVLGNSGALVGMQAGATLVDHTTASADVAREIDNLAAPLDVNFVDAPVSGGEAGAVNGVLTIMCGGSEKAFALAEPVIAAYARACALIGPTGSGQLTKMVNQVCIAGVLQGLSEGLHFGQSAGLDMTKVLDVITKGAAQSWQMDNRAQTMCDGEYNFGFAVNWMRKDLAIVMQHAATLGLSLPATQTVDESYRHVQGFGGQRWDTSSLIEASRRRQS